MNEKNQTDSFHPEKIEEHSEKGSKIHEKRSQLRYLLPEKKILKKIRHSKGSLKDNKLLINKKRKDENGKIIEKIIKIRYHSRISHGKKPK